MTSLVPFILPTGNESPFRRQKKRGRSNERMCTHYFAVEVLQSPSHIHSTVSFGKAKGVERSVGTMRRHNIHSEMRSLWCIAKEKGKKYSILSSHILKITGVAPNDPASANIDSAPQKYTPPDYPAGGFNIITHQEIQ